MLRRALLLLTVLVSGLYAAGKWVRVETPEIEVLSSAGSGTAREALRRFEQIRHVFEARTQKPNTTPVPVRVFVFRSEAEFQPFQITESAAGYYQPGHERDYIAMQVSGPDIYRVVYHEYAHLLMRHGGYRVPVWLNEGTAELFSTVVFDRDEVRIGDLIQSHILTLRDEKTLDLPALLAVDNTSPYYNERRKAGIFYAQSWALVHMLNFSPGYQPGLANFLQMILNGEDQVRAFQQAFGKTPANIMADLASYVRRDRFTGVRLRVPKLQSSGKLPAVTLDEEEAELMRADLFLAISRNEQAEAIYAKLAAQEPLAPEIQEALGYLALRRNQDEVALRYYDRAIQLGSRSARLRYDYATLLREKGEPDERVAAMLKEAVALDANLFEAHYLLGYLALRHERPADAIEPLKRAAEIQPGRAAVWEYLALAYQQTGKREKAIHAAKTARRQAATPEDAARIDATIKLIEESSGPVVKYAPPPLESVELAHSTPKAPGVTAAQGIMRIEGVLGQIDCVGRVVRLHIITVNSKVFILLRDPGAVILKNAGSVSTDLACGPANPRNVIVEYRANADPTYGTSGDAITIEFR
jgi:tetratricopeptide (TPR) repeat protein